MTSSAQQAVAALARAVDAKDPNTKTHCEVVSGLCALIGRELRLKPQRVERLALAGLLHDVGKIAVSDEILLKPGPLTDGEFEVMKSHSAIGHRIVRDMGLGEEADWVLHHHERPDGRGYPDGLSGAAIPLESRIIFVADSFEAMISDRPYRKGRPEHEALAELERHAGTQFDPACVAALRAVIAGHGAAAPQSALAAA
jgi:HD-GYP domain-containing protein (c-di-GMP phosphodiesterase class II)